MEQLVTELLHTQKLIIKFLAVALIISVFLLFASNAIWIYAWNLPSTVITNEQDAEGNGVNNAVIGDGGIEYGESNTTD